MLGDRFSHSYFFQRRSNRAKVTYRSSLGKPIVPIVVERRSLINLYQISMQEACGITGTAHQWITNYLRNRIQFVQIGNSKSDALRQICGVPQGSILGPSFSFFISMISQPVLMNFNLYYLLMTLVYFLNAVTWIYLPPILTTSSTMFQLG